MPPVCTPCEAVQYFFGAVRSHLKHRAVTESAAITAGALKIAVRVPQHPIIRREGIGRADKTVDYLFDPLFISSNTVPQSEAPPVKVVP